MNVENLETDFLALLLAALWKVGAEPVLVRWLVLVSWRPRTRRFRRFLLPGTPLQVRQHLGAVMLCPSPGLGWVRCPGKGGDLPSYSPGIHTSFLFPPKVAASGVLRALGPAAFLAVLHCPAPLCERHEAVCRHPTGLCGIF